MLAVDCYYAIIVENFDFVDVVDYVLVWDVQDSKNVVDFLDSFLLKYKKIKELYKIF